MANIPRLQRLYKLVAQQPNLDMFTWGTQGPCGTAACALGTAALDPQWNKEGLTVQWEPADELTSSMLDRIHTNHPHLRHADEYEIIDELDIQVMKIFYQNSQNSDAGAQFFDLTYEEAKNLFHPFHYASEPDCYPNENIVPTAAVLRRIQRIIDKYRVPDTV